MGDIGTLLNGTVEFPDGGAGFLPFIGKFVFILVSAMYGHGALGYGFAIIFFTILFKLMLSPLDFGNKFFTTRNQRQMQKMKPEEDAIKEQFAGDPMAINRARQELYRKNGYKMGGYCLFMVINLFLTLAIFLSVYSGLRAIADYNIKLTVVEMQGIYRTYDAEGTWADPENVDEATLDAFRAEINATYAKHSVGFLWIKNIWKADTPWTSSALTPNDYLVHFNNWETITDEELANAQAAAINKDKVKTKKDYYHSMSKSDRKVIDKRAEAVVVVEYGHIYSAIDAKYKRKWNGLLFLIILAGATTWASVYFNAKLTNKKKEAEKPKEAVVQYSMRNAKSQRDGATPNKPAIDPVMANKMMKFILPGVMVLFTLQSTAALAIYIIMSSLMTTGVNLAMIWPVNKLVDWTEARRKRRDSAPPDQTGIINPHAKYFKNTRKGG